MAAFWLRAVVFLVAILKAQSSRVRLSLPKSPKVNGDLILDGGDLYLTREQRDMLYGGADLSVSKRNMVADANLRWTNATMPYKMAPNHFNEYEISQIGRAMTEWERYTCMFWRFAKDGESNFAYFQNGGGGCNSQLGMVGSAQAINLEAPGCRFKGLYLHEIGHAIGLIHEHQRPDRDNFLWILSSNIARGMEDSFTKYKADFINTYGSPYEYTSIMHYGLNAFSRGSYREFQTMRVKFPEKKDSVGLVYLKELAYSDVYIVNQAYKCADHCPDKNKCGSGGHLNEFCECICKDGSSDCDTTKQNQDTDCKNDYQNSWACYVWANQGECERNPNFMNKDCAKACGVCGAGRGERTVCEDKLSKKKCEAWRGRGDCGSNPHWMNLHCGKTCNFCGPNKEGCTNVQDPEKCKNWALDGECGANPMWMWENCALACGNCDGQTPPTPKPRRKPKPGECQDDHDLCESWASTGECDANPNYMKSNCKLSCNTCGTDTGTDSGACSDNNDQCSNWASTGECQANPVWMSENCKKSCNKCNGGGNDNGNNDDKDTGGACSDNNDQCSSWASTGECQANQVWMSENCKKSCNKCNGGGTDNGNNDDKDKDTGGECTDSNDTCSAWAANGDCKKNPGWMLPNCRKSCKQCKGGATDDDGGNTGGGSCIDLNSGCPNWKSYCSRAHIAAMCKQSCGQC